MSIERITRAYAAKVDVSDGERAVVARINTGDVDRYGTVIEPAGIDLKAYRTNPVVLWEHGQDGARGKVPIGRNAWVKLDKGDNALIAKTIFHDDPFSDGLFRLYQNDVLRGFSINGLPKSYGPPTDKERKDRPDMGSCHTVYRNTELTEYSAVSVPGNRSALTLAVSRGLWLPDSLKRADAMNEEDEEPVEESAQKRYIKEENGKWCVYSEAGKRLGEYDTKAEAEDRLKEIEGHKQRSAPELPPLVGRRFADALESTIFAVRGEVARAREEEEARRDLRRGVV